CRAGGGGWNLGRAYSAARGIGGGARRRRACRSSIGSCSRELEYATATARTSHPLSGSAGQKSLQLLIPLELAARLREKMHAGGVAACHQHEVARLQLNRGGLAAIELRETNGTHAPTTTGAEHGRACEHRDAGRARVIRGSPFPGAHIRDSGDEYARLLQF